MIKELITTLLRPELGEFALRVNNALQRNELSLNEFSELIITLHRLSLYSYYEITDPEYRNLSGDYRYWNPDTLCDNGEYFALLCLRKIIEDNKAQKQDALVIKEDSKLDIRELIAKLELAAETIGDEDELTEYWAKDLSAFISWSPDSSTDFRIGLLDVMNPENADIIFGMCTGFSGVLSPDKLKDYQATEPEEFFTASDLREYHSKRLRSSYFEFLETANDNERDKIYGAEEKIEKAQSVKELLYAFAEEDVYLDKLMTFPFTVYRLLTDSTYSVLLKKIPTEQEIVSDDQDIPDELKGVFALAKDGDAAAQSELASRYLSGSKLPQDEYRAVYWLKLAAEGGDALAQTNYGVALQNRLGGLERNYTEAIEWFMKAAAQNEPVAQYNLGLAYAKGLGVKRDLREMDRWMKLSADGGYLMAQLVLQNGLIIRD